ncbi:GPI mannosyltransferase 2 [Gossypium arboreum]|uniref:GPI mannosyltransferase 2 n=1 Tax=Gossypium arboreum TaxID=29729 RepID=A0A0B0M8T0_GOSAR|nr:GPI mannosyltransferase 2 [Gossypium arboreum]
MCASKTLSGTVTSICDYIEDHVWDVGIVRYMCDYPSVLPNFEWFIGQRKIVNKCEI